jgi:penicillin-insensitive murein endopeptidase
VGSPTEGKLVDGVRLEEGPAIRVVPVYAGGDVRYGTRHLVHLLERAAARVRQKFPDSVLSVGHLSKRGGGELDHHASHESGRDADVGFYVSGAGGKALYAPHFVAFTGDAHAKTWPGARFDDAKNWAFVEALLTDPEAHVTHVFVAQPLKDRLMAYATKMQVREALRTRAAEALMQPKGALPHDDHFHVRISCPRTRQGEACIENPERKVARSARGHGRTASRGHGQTGASARPAPPAPSHTTKPAAPAKPVEPAREQAKSEPRHAKKAPPEEPRDVPKLGPVVPGLDSVVIPAPMDDVDGMHD